MNPDSRGDMRDAALPVGKPYSDPTMGGPKITVMSATAEKAVIKVELSTGGGDPNSPGQGTCEDGTAFQAPGPATCAAPIGSPPAMPEPDAGAPTPDAGSPPADAETTTPAGSDAAPPNPDDPSAGSGSGGSGGNAGTGGSSGEGSRRGGQSGSGNAGSPGRSEDPAPVMVTPKGCGCRTAGEGGGPGATPLLPTLLLAGVLVARRRRRRS